MEMKFNLPLLPLRDIVVFPSMVIPLFVGRDKSINALNEVMKKEKKIILVTNKKKIDVKKFKNKVKIIKGGKERSDSSFLGIKYAKKLGAKNVFIHDAARPNFSINLLKNISKSLKKNQAVVPFINSSDSIKYKTKLNYFNLNRKNILKTQTPQAFRLENILKLSEMSKLYSLLSSSENAELEQISRAMTTNPIMISDNNKFDTEIIKASHGQVIGKGGAEGIQCLCKVNEGIGLALKVEDGSKRAKHAVSLHLLKQLEWISDLRIQDIEEKVFNFPEGVRLEVKGKVKFQES